MNLYRMTENHFPESFPRELIPAWPSALSTTFCSQDCLDIQNRNPYTSYQKVLIKKTNLYTSVIVLRVLILRLGILRLQPR